MFRYCVRPNSGTIPPNGNVEVQVLLQAMKEDPPLDAKCRDKFLVQSVPIGGAESSGGFPAMWSSIEKTNKSAIQERKIRVNFLPANTSATPNGVATQDHQQHQPDDDPPAYSSPPPQFGSPISSTTSNTVPIDSKPVGAKSLSDAKASASNPATTKTNSSISNATTAASNAASAVTSALPTSTEELKQQLAEARTQIAKLKDSAADSGLRQRKLQEAGEKLQTAMPPGGETGVPLQMVAGLCLLSFLLAYFFF